MKFAHRLALGFWVSFLVMIASETLFYRPWMDTVEYVVLTTLFLSVLALGWVLADSKEKNVEVSRLLKIFVVAVPILAVPYYRFRHFGTKVGFTFLAIIIAFVSGLLLVSFALHYLSTGS